MVLFLLVSSLLPSPFVWGNFAEAAAADKAGIEIYNNLIAFQQCSHGDKEWHICRGEYQPLQYCPAILEFNSSHLPERMPPCFTCPDANSDCHTVVGDVLDLHIISAEASYDDDWGLIIADELVSVCQYLCEAGTKGDACWSNSYTDYDGNRVDSCTSGSSFCDFASDDDFIMNISGTCKACPLDQDDCYKDGFVSSLEGKRNCAGCRLDCYDEGKSTLTVNGQEILSSLLQSATHISYQNASGPLRDCSELLLENDDLCLGAEGHICVLDYSILGDSQVAGFEWNLSNRAKWNGCVAIVAIPTEGFYWNDVEGLAIPIIEIYPVTEDARKKLLKNEPNVMAQVEVQLFGSTCFSKGYEPRAYNCNTKVPCAEGEYCFYFDVVVDGVYTEGTCKACPTLGNGEPDPAGCFFDRQDFGYTFSSSSLELVKSCAQACNATLVDYGCKFCPSEVSAFDFGVEDKADKCSFCPKNDVEYPDKLVPLFGENVTCWMMQTFFNRMEVHKDSSNCRLVQSMNYLCGCDGTGYAGANTEAKQVVLVWLPRVSAILSMVGSLFIIFDTMRTRQKRGRLMNQLLSALSLFDIMGSISYSLTTLPTPASDELYGAQGNERTCTAQGFFIQIGTVACFLNVSLALYYFLTIKHGWTLERLKRKRAEYFLLIPPISIGLAYAFVGIPHYENVRVWCNNSAKWWPEVPVILAIIAATGIMGNLCYYVYKIEQRTNQYTNGGARHSMSLFKQSCWFVIAFYITWIPYLVLQYMLSSGEGYDNYILILSSSTLVPLQGFWNNVVYVRPRYLSNILSQFSSPIHSVSCVFKRFSKPNSTEQPASEELQKSGAHPQLQVVQVDEKVVMNVLENEGDTQSTPKENELHDKPSKTAPDNKLPPNFNDEVGRFLAIISDQSGNVTHSLKENVDRETPARMSNNQSAIDKTAQKQKSHEEAKGGIITKDNMSVEADDGYRAFLAFLQS